MKKKGKIFLIMAELKKPIKIALFFIIVVICFGCSKKADKTEEMAKIPEETEIRVEYGFDTDTGEFVVHNLMPFTLSEALVSLDVYYRNAYQNRFQMMERMDIPPDEWLYISTWESFRDETENVELIIPEGQRIAFFYLTCNEGEIEEEFKEPN